MFGGSLKSADLGAQLAEETTDAMDAVVQKAGEVRERVNDIASATKEQERGIVQIDTAVREMGGVTEENAANAEESASAAEELSSHSLSLRA
ncbi:MAG: methyl-accepting chemotaxis protein, partial [Planctomycetota bacterium]|nr:methyl-accepting chemotaxis protein [Planctomycetota bacterium]